MSSTGIYKHLFCAWLCDPSWERTDELHGVQPVILHAGFGGMLERPAPRDLTCHLVLKGCGPSRAAPREHQQPRGWRVGACCVHEEQGRVSARRGHKCKGARQPGPLKHRRSLGTRGAQPDTQPNSLATRGRAILQIWAFLQPPGELLFQIRAAGR